MSTKRFTRTPEQNEALLGRVLEFSLKYPQFAISAVCNLMGWSVTTMNATIVRTGVSVPSIEGQKQQTIKDYVFSMFADEDLEGIESFLQEVKAVRNVAASPTPSEDSDLEDLEDDSDFE